MKLNLLYFKNLFILVLFINFNKKITAQILQHGDCQQWTGLQ